MRRQIWFDADHEGRCFGCGPANPSGLKLRFYETDDGVESE